MRVRGLRAVMPVLVAGTGLGLCGGLARAEGAAPVPGAPAAAVRVPTPNVAAAPAGLGQKGERQQAWWARAREVLFRDLALSPEQTRAVDGILETQEEARARSQELQAELATARRERKHERSAALREELRKVRTKLKSPHAVIDEMRALLTDEQRPTFDMNRAHLVAESQQTRNPQPGRRASRPGAGAEPDTE